MCIKINKKKIHTKDWSVLPSRFWIEEDWLFSEGCAIEMAVLPDIISYKTIPKAYTSSFGETSPYKAYLKKVWFLDKSFNKDTYNTIEHVNYIFSILLGKLLWTFISS